MVVHCLSDIFCTLVTKITSILKGNLIQKGYSEGGFMLPKENISTIIQEMVVCMEQGQVEVDAITCYSRKCSGSDY